MTGEVLPWICNLCQKKTKCCVLESKWKINYDLLVESCALTLHSSFTYKRQDLVSKEEEKTIHVQEAKPKCFTAFYEHQSLAHLVLTNQKSPALSSR